MHRPNEYCKTIKGDPSIVPVLNIYESCLEVEMKFDNFSFLDGEKGSLAEIDTWEIILGNGEEKWSALYIH